MPLSVYRKKSII